MSVRGEYWWIRLHADGVDWAHCFSGESLPRQEGSCDSIETVPAPDGARLVLCVPGERARMHNVSLPSTNRKHALAALPYALEDQLLHDVNSYHLVPLQPAGGAKDVPVVVIEKAWLSALLAQCSRWHMIMMAPDYLFIPEPEKGSWLLDAGAVPLLLRKPGYKGAALVGEIGLQIPGALLLALEQGDTVPHKLKIRVTGHQQYKFATGWSAVLSERGIELEVFIDELARGAWLSRQPLPDLRVNLLTGPYAVKQSQLPGVGRLKTALVLAAALILAGGIHWIVQGLRIQAEHERLQQQIEATYLRVFPETRNLVDPRFQMEQQLNSLRNGKVDAKQDFLDQLDTLSIMLAAQPDCQVQQINFDGNAMTLEISVADYESFERLQRQLTRAVKLDVENAELRDGRVHGRIRVGGRA